MGSKKGSAICDGNINTAKIYAAHSQIKEIVSAYKNVNLEVEQITATIRENWVGAGRDEFQSQYNILIRKIDDFGEILQEIYEALVTAEADYETADDEVRQSYVMAMDEK